MNLAPLAGFYWRRHQQISALTTDGRGKHIFLDFVLASSTVLKKYWPELNKDGLLDDFTTTLVEVLTDVPPREDQS